MSLTEEQKTAKNFQEYHKRILPYLNGSFPTPIVNKFSKGDLYSTDEKIIGQWIDGKPLYQKTFTGLSFNLINGWTDTGVTVASLSIDNVIEAKCLISAAGNKTSSSVATSLRSGAVTIFVEGLSGTTVTDLTLQYTKTTDSSISIGDGNDYSTDEQVVGTWIDGKPLYQKTMVFDGTYTGDMNVVNIGSEKVVHFLKGGATQSNGAFLTIPNINASWSASNVGLFIDSTGVVKLRAGSETCSHLEITIQYTKTTD